MVTVPTVSFLNEKLSTIKSEVKIGIDSGSNDCITIDISTYFDISFYCNIADGLYFKIFEVNCQREFACSDCDCIDTALRLLNSKLLA
jgi:hypothetical protein